MKEYKNLDLLTNLSNATARTLAKDRKTNVEFNKTNNPKSKDSQISINLKNHKKKGSIRGNIDFHCFNKRFLNKKIYNQFLPKLKLEKELYEIIHIARSSSLGMINYEGSFLNIRDFFNLHDLDSKYENIIINHKPILFFLIDFFCKKKIIEISKNRYLPTNQENEIISRLKKFIKKHIFFSKLAKELSQKISSTENKEKELQDDSNQINENKNENTPNTTNNEQQHSKYLVQKYDIKTSDAKIRSDNEDKKNNYEGLNNKKNKTNMDKSRYKVFTQRHDLIANASKLAEKSELNLLKKKLDKESPKFDSLIRQLANRLERKLMANQLRAWEFDIEEGILDSSKLTRIVLNPNNNLTFKKETNSNSKNTIVCLLLDNSGSMRGRPIMIAANAVEVLTKTLERCGVKVEILGFTTKEWKGGKSKIDWVNQGKIEKPGRLNDILHIIYKDSETNWKNCNKNLGLVLKEGLLKENIDGEALIWANKRLLQKEQKKKILIVISDGAPVDDSTLSSNNSNLLESHLIETVNHIEQAKKIDLMAIGIGHDVSKYYKKAFTIDDVSKLAEVMLGKLTELFERKKTII